MQAVLDRTLGRSEGTIPTVGSQPRAAPPARSVELVLLSTTTSRELTDPCALVPLAPWYCLAFGSMSGMPPSLTLHLPLLLACDCCLLQQYTPRPMSPGRDP